MTRHPGSCECYQRIVPHYVIDHVIAPCRSDFDHSEAVLARSIIEVACKLLLIRKYVYIIVTEGSHLILHR